MSISAGTRHEIGTSHREVLAWLKTAAPGDELRVAKGLYLRRTTGEAHWMFRYSSPVTGRQMRVHPWAGDPGGQPGFPAASLDEARLRAAKLRALIKDGIDPVLQVEQARAEAEAAAASALLQAQAAAEEAAKRRTVRQLFADWQTAALRPALRADGRRTGRKDGGEYVRQQFERHLFPAIGHLPIETLAKGDILPLLDAQTAAGKIRTAKVLLTDLKQMLDFAVDRDLMLANPLATVRKAKIGGIEAPRERVLSEAELTELAGKVQLARMSPRSQLAIWLILATGVRVGECMGAIWADASDHPALAVAAEEAGAKFGVVDLQAKTWYLPTTKNQRDHTIHLSTFALKQLAALRELRESDDSGKPVAWVFPATDLKRPVCIKSFGKQLADRQRPAEARMQGRSKATQSLALAGGRWTAHDLRRTAATLMARLGVSTDVIDECLNHKLQSQVARVYVHDRREREQAAAFDLLGDLLSELEGSLVLPRG